MIPRPVKVIGGIVIIVFGISFIMAYVTNKGLVGMKKSKLAKEQIAWRMSAQRPNKSAFDIISDGYKFTQIYRDMVTQQDVVKWGWKITGIRKKTAAISSKDNNEVKPEDGKRAGLVFTIQYNLLNKEGKVLAYDTAATGCLLEGEAFAHLREPDTELYDFAKVAASEAKIVEQIPCSK